MRTSLRFLSICFVGFLLSESCYGSWTNSVGMVFVKIPIATKTNNLAAIKQSRTGMGEDHNRKPKKSYWLSVTETTQAQWRLVMGNNPSGHKGKNLPVEFISWAQAVDFCNRLSRKEGCVYRLPTEAEWELACRSGTKDQGTTNLAKYAWTLDNASKKSKTHPVGQLAPNAWGFFDMQGNVAEWCLDASVWKDDKGKIHRGYRVVKGGSFAYFARDAQPNRSLSYLGGTNEDFRIGDVGFRVLKE